MTGYRDILQHDWLQRHIAAGLVIETNCSMTDYRDILQYDWL